MYCKICHKRPNFWKFLTGDLPVRYDESTNVFHLTFTSYFWWYQYKFEYTFKRSVLAITPSRNVQWPKTYHWLNRGTVLCENYIFTYFEPKCLCRYLLKDLKVSKKFFLQKIFFLDKCFSCKSCNQAKLAKHLACCLQWKWLLKWLSSDLLISINRQGENHRIVLSRKAVCNYLPASRTGLMICFLFTYWSLRKWRFLFIMTKISLHISAKIIVKTSENHNIPRETPLPSQIFFP